jgi:pentatricopeptide repeat protein
MMTILQHNHGTAFHNKKKAIEWMKLDLEESKLSLDPKTFDYLYTKLQLYQDLLKKGSIDDSIRLVKGSGHWGKSILCLLLRIRHQEKGSLDCYKWMKSLLEVPWKEDDVPIFYQWSTEACHLLLQYLCKDGHMDTALLLVEDMHKLDLELTVHGYNHLISGFFRKNDYEQATKTFETLRERAIPNNISYNWMIQLSLNHSE